MTQTGSIEMLILAALCIGVAGVALIGITALVTGRLSGRRAPSDFLPPRASSIPEPVSSETVAAEPSVAERAGAATAAPFERPAIEPAPQAPSAEAAPISKPARATDWFGGLRKTRNSWVAGLGRLLGAKNALDAATLEELEDLLFGADLGTRTADQLLEVARRAGAPDRVREAIAAEALRILSADATANANPDAAASAPGAGESASGKPATAGPDVGSERAGESTGAASNSRAATRTPHVVMVVGVNGAGKTTSIGKLAHRAVQAGEDVILAAADTFRAAAVDQLEVWAQRCGAEFVRTRPGGDPAAVAFDAVKAAHARSAGRVFIDTAGRLQTDKGLMDELQKIARVVKKEIPDAPHEVLLVLDAHTGQNAIRQAQEFTKAVPVSGIVLTKLDGTAKGGVILGITEETGIPVRYVGIGEGVEDLADFDARAFVEALFAD